MRVASAVILAVLLVLLAIWGVARLWRRAPLPAPVPRLESRAEPTPPDSSRPLAKTSTADRNDGGRDAEARSFPFELTLLSEETLEPLDGAIVTATRERSPDATASSALSDTAGTARLELAEPGPWGIVVERAGYRRAALRGVRLPLRRRLTLARSCAFSGRVVDDRGQPVEGATVEVDDARRIDFGWMREPSDGASAQTDAAGRFSLDGVPEVIEIVLRARAEGYRPARSSRFRLESGNVLEGIEIVLPAGEGVVEGVVRAPDGTPRPGAVVSLEGPTEESSSSRYYDWGDVRTDASGRFRFASLFSGSYRLGFSAVGLGIGRSSSFTVTVGETVVQELQLKEVPLVSGRVVDPAGRPVAGCKVDSMRVLAQPTYTAADGRFEYAMNQQEVELLFVAPGFTLRRLKVAAREEPWTVTLTPSVRVTVRLRPAEESGEEKLELGVIRVTAWVREGPDPTKAKSIAGSRWIERSASESFSFDLPAGWLFLTLTPIGYVPQTVKAELRAGEPALIDVPLQRGATIRGRVVEVPSGAPIADALIVLQPGENQQPPVFVSSMFIQDHNEDLGHARSEEDGRFEIRGVQPWSESDLDDRNVRIVWARAAGFAIGKSRELRLDDGATEDVIIPLQRGARLTGQLRGWESPDRVFVPSDELDSTMVHAGYLHDSEPVTLATILARGKPIQGSLGCEVEEVARVFEVASDGTFAVEGLPAGTHELIVLGVRHTIALRHGEERHVVVDLRSESVRRLCLVRGGLPIAGASVTVDDFGSDVETNEDGFFGWFPPGSRSLVVELPEAQPKRLRVEIPPGRGVVDVEADAEASYIDGVIHRKGGGDAFFVVFGWTLALFPGSATPDDLSRPLYTEYRSYHESTDGPFRLGPVPPGRYRVGLLPAAEFGPVLSEPIDVSERGAKGVHLELRDAPADGGVLEIRATEAGVAVRRGLVRLMRPVTAEAYWSADGPPRFTGLGPGVYVGVVEAEYLRGPAEQWFSVRLPREEPLHLTVGEGGTLDITVVDPSGARAAGAEVVLYLPSGIEILRLSGRPTRTDSGGRLWLDKLGAGTYTLAARRGAEEGERTTVTLADGEVRYVRLSLR